MKFPQTPSLTPSAPHWTPNNPIPAPCPRWLGESSFTVKILSPRRFHQPLWQEHDFDDNFTVKFSQTPSLTPSLPHWTPNNPIPAPCPRWLGESSFTVKILSPRRFHQPLWQEHDFDDNFTVKFPQTSSSTLKYASRDNSGHYLSANFLTSNMVRNGTRIDFIWAELSLDAYFRKIATRWNSPNPHLQPHQHPVEPRWTPFQPPVPVDWGRAVLPIKFYLPDVFTNHYDGNMIFTIATRWNPPKSHFQLLSTKKTNLTCIDFSTGVQKAQRLSNVCISSAFNSNAKFWS